MVSHSDSPTYLADISLQIWDVFVIVFFGEALPESNRRWPIMVKLELFEVDHVSENPSILYVAD